MALSDLKCRNAKPGSKLTKLSDGGGLQLWITPAGGKIWKLAYRFDGAQKSLTIGPYPAFGLGDAREKRDEAKRMLVEGRDPSVAKRLDRLARASASATTFKLLAEELLAKKAREGRADATLAKTAWLLEFAYPLLGDRPISEISSLEVLEALRKVEARGRHESARRMRSVIGEVFRYAISTARAANDPTVALRGALTAPTVKHRAAVTDPNAFGALLRAIDGFDGQPTTKAALQLMAYLFPRPGELRLAEWREFDMDNAVWIIPAARTKMRREHRVPLPPQAIAILKQLRRITGDGKAGLVFPSVRSVMRPISENTLNAALRRLGYGTDEATSHGFRATASTLLNESRKFSADAIERALAHQDADAVRRAYARGEHWEERVDMMRWWANECDRLREGAKILPLARA